MPVPNIQMRDMDAMNSTTTQKYPKKKKAKKNLTKQLQQKLQKRKKPTKL